MVSEDTEQKTLQLLEKNNYFGMEKDQISLMKQGKVPALMSNDAQIAVLNPYEVDSKPHGHGDVHYLLHSSGIAEKWLSNGIEWITFFQDTNALAFFTLPAVLGVSVELGLDVNSLSVPRYAKQAVGAITKLVHEDGREMTINVEYNQLDPLLRSTISKDGDVNDPKTGLSLFPGNINQLLFRLAPYVKVINESNGLMPEFVNPKYKDETKTLFKKPTRLECMMQDYPRLLPRESKVGFTMAPAWICYSPCKNNAADAAAAIASGVPSASPLIAESDQYSVFAKMLRGIGATVEEGEAQNYLGISGVISPRIVFHPSFVLFPHEMRSRFPNPSAIYISNRSTLVIAGDVTIEALSLDGSLSIGAASYTSLVVNIPAEKKIVNAGHEIVAIDPKDMNYPEKDRMRGYVILAKEVKSVTTSANANSHLDGGKYLFDGTDVTETERNNRKRGLEEEKVEQVRSVVPRVSIEVSS
jgi:UDP-sugar pyrophosphorylase